MQPDPLQSLSDQEATVQNMLKPFLNYPVVVETSRGQVVGVLAEAITDTYGNISSLLVHQFVGDWRIVRAWNCLKTLRDHC